MSKSNSTVTDYAFIKPGMCCIIYITLQWELLYVSACEVASLLDRQRDICHTEATGGSGAKACVCWKDSFIISFIVAKGAQRIRERGCVPGLDDQADETHETALTPAQCKTPK